MVDLARQGYFEWLISKVGPLASSYEILLDVAFSVDFYEIVSNDINREDEGIHFRKEYFLETGKPDPMGDAPCTFLEMLIALSQRLNTIAYDYKNSDNAPYWFWVMIKNLHMSELVDELVDPLTEEDIRKRFVNVVKRQYLKNGTGGLFPINRSNRDQRKVELWYQMMDWLYENVDL